MSPISILRIVLLINIIGVSHGQDARPAEPAFTDTQRPEEQSATRASVLGSAGEPELLLDEQNDLAGQWRGYYDCEGGRKIFMRLGFISENNQLAVRFDFSSGLVGMYPTGAISLAGDFAPDTRKVDLNPLEWIDQPRGEVEMIGFEGQLSEDKTAITGTVTNTDRCSTFSVSKYSVKEQPVNSEGLIFHYHGRNDITATVKDCRTYANWLGAGKMVTLRGGNVFSGWRDPETMRQVLGKDLHQWDNDAVSRMREMNRYCRALLQSQGDPDTKALMERVEDAVPAWAIGLIATNPKYDRDSKLTNRWLQLEQAIMVNEQQVRLAATLLDHVKTMPADLSSIEKIDEWLGRKNNSQNSNQFLYLSREERQDFIEDLEEARDQITLEVATEMAKAWQEQPSTVDGFKAVKATFNDQKKQLARVNADKAIKMLEKYFEDASALRSESIAESFSQQSNSSLFEIEGVSYGMIITQARQELVDRGYEAVSRYSFRGPGMRFDQVGLSVNQSHTGETVVIGITVRNVPPGKTDSSASQSEAERVLADKTTNLGEPICDSGQEMLGEIYDRSCVWTLRDGNADLKLTHHTVTPGSWQLTLSGPGVLELPPELSEAMDSGDISHEDMYKRGLKLEQEKKFSEAAWWYRRATRKPDDGISREEQLSAAWWNDESIPKGHILAHYRLGNFYFDGRGVEQSYFNAESNYRSAALNGHAKSMNELGVINGHGLNGSASLFNAAYWYRSAIQYAALNGDQHTVQIAKENLSEVMQAMNEYVRSLQIRINSLLVEGCPWDGSYCWTQNAANDLVNEKLRYEEKLQELKDYM